MRQVDFFNFATNNSLSQINYKILKIYENDKDFFKYKLDSQCVNSSGSQIQDTRELFHVKEKPWPIKHHE